VLLGLKQDSTAADFVDQFGKYAGTIHGIEHDDDVVKALHFKVGG